MATTAKGQVVLSLVTTVLTLSVLGKVPAPQNVRIHSVNLKSSLLWDPVFYNGSNVNYTVRYISRAKETPTELCTDITVNECDFSTSTVFGNFTFSVRAQYLGETSDWASALPFSPLEDTMLGPPPEVTVKSRLGLLDISIKDALNDHTITPLKNYYSSLVYQIEYWENSSNPEVRVVTAHHTYYTLSELKHWTTYCLQVRVFITESDKKGPPSEVICKETIDDGKTPVWIIVCVLILSIVTVLLVALGAFFTVFYIYRTTKFLFFPSYTFPEHLKEYLNKPSSAASCVAPQLSKDADECCDKLSIISEESGNCSQESADANANFMDFEEQSSSEQEDSPNVLDGESIQNALNQKPAYGTVIGKEAH